MHSGVQDVLISHRYASIFMHITSLTVLISHLILICIYLFPFLFWQSGTPEPNITWTKDGAEIIRRNGQVRYNKWSIVLVDLVPSDSGLYKCKVCNIHECIDYTTRLEVQGMQTKIKMFFRAIFSVDIST